MEGAEDCCRAVHDAQLCTLALAGTGTEALLRTKREKTFDVVHSSRAASAYWCQRQTTAHNLFLM